MEYEGQWWQGFFSGLLLEAQREGYEASCTKAEAEFVSSVLGDSLVGNVLDIPCGTGRHALLLAEQGYDIAAADRNRLTVKDGLVNTDRKQQIFWIVCDMRAIPWRETFEAAYCLGGSFGYFDDDGNIDFLQSVFNALRPGARFLLDTLVEETVLSRFKRKRKLRMGSVDIKQKRRYDPLTKRILSHSKLRRGERRESRYSSVRLYSHEDLLALLTQVGFVDIESFGSPRLEEFSPTSPRLYLTMHKPTYAG